MLLKNVKLDVQGHAFIPQWHGGMLEIKICTEPRYCFDKDQADFLSDVMGVPRDSSFSLANKNITANTLVEKSDKREKTRFYRDLLTKLGLKDILTTLEEENKLEIEFFHYAEKLNEAMLDQWKKETGYTSR